jgi:hypothetical protein
MYPTSASLAAPVSVKAGRCARRWGRPEVCGRSGEAVAAALPAVGVSRSTTRTHGTTRNGSADAWRIAVSIVEELASRFAPRRSGGDVAEPSTRPRWPTRAAANQPDRVARSAGRGLGAAQRGSSGRSPGNPGREDRISGGRVGGASRRRALRLGPPPLPARLRRRDPASAERRAPSAERRAPSTEHRAPSTEHRAPSTEHRAPSTECRAPSTEHRVPSAERRAPSTERRATTSDGEGLRGRQPNSPITPPGERVGVWAQPSGVAGAEPR